MIDYVTKYAKEVLAGNIVACNLVKLACKRHMNDLKKAKTKKYPYRFDVELANKHLEFFKLLKHYKGEFAGQNIELELWQMFRVGSVFGWIEKETGYRRFRIAYNQVPRKNGKSTEAAGVGIDLMSIDGEEGAEVYSAATKKDQAKIIFNDAKKMIKASPFIKKKIDIFRNNINMPLLNSKFEPLSADADTLDGLNVHGALIDEFHAHKTREVYDVLLTGTGARRQPLIWIVTTAGLRTDTVCYETYEYGKKILEGAIEDDRFFVYIACADEDDDPFDEGTWWKANPNLGVSCSIEDLRVKAKQAKELPAAYTSFVVKHLNMWVNADVAWMNMQKYVECEKVNADFNIEDLEGKKCFIGIDLSATTDITSVSMEFPLDDGRYAWIQKSFLPEENMVERERRDKVPYSAWARQGWITLTPGETVDYDWIKSYIIEQAKKYDVQELCLDPWNSSQFSNSMMEEGFTCVEIRQGFRTMSEPIKDVEKLVLNKQLITFGNPLLKWAFSNAVPTFDPAANIKLDKAKSSRRIDPVIAGINAHVRGMQHEYINEDLNSHILNDDWSL